MYNFTGEIVSGFVGLACVRKMDLEKCSRQVGTFVSGT